MRSVAQERAAELLITQVDKVIVGMPNEQDNVLYVLMDEHTTKSPAGDEIARLVIDPSGFVIWATFEHGREEEFEAIFDEYIRAVGIVHPTEYRGVNKPQDAAETD